MAEPSTANVGTNYDDWFTITPEPWDVVAHLVPGGDRTAAATVEAAVLHAEPAQHGAMEKRLLRVLARADTTDEAKRFVCRMLALIGTSAAVPGLVALLNEIRTADIARYALDAIDDRAVDQAYRMALSSLTGAPKAGLIGSIAMRHDTAALGAMEEIARNPAEPSEVRVAAERAIQRLTANERSAAR